LNDIRKHWTCNFERRFPGRGHGEANRKNVQPVLRYRHQQGLIGPMMPLGESFADIDLGSAGGGADNIQFEMSWVWAGLA
jgi:hypothetical protein